MTTAPDRNIRPQVHDIGPLRLDNAATEQLANGITLHIVSGGASHLCRIGILLPGGIMEQPEAGLYRAVASLLPEGSMETPGKMMSDILETNGAWTGSSVTTHHTLINIYCLDTVFPTILSLARQMVFSPEFASDLTARTLRQLSSRSSVERHKVMDNATHALKERLYGGESPMSQWIDPDGILTITPDTLREAHHRRLDTTKMHIYLAGAVTDEMIDAVRNEFGEIVTDTRFDFTPVSLVSNPDGGEIYTEVEGAVQNAIVAAIPVPGRRHPDFYNLRFAAIALGGYFGSRLMANIREEKGLTYGIDAQLYAHPDGGYLQIATQSDCHNTEGIITEIVAEIERLMDPASFSPDEMQRLTRFVLSSLASSLDTPFMRMDFLQTREISETPADYFARQEAAIRSLTPDILASTARKYLTPNRLIFSIAGKR